MTWSYDVAQLSANPTYQVRRMIGDVVVAKPQLQDEEIALQLTQNNGSVLAASETCCRALSAFYARDVDTIQQELRTVYSQRAKMYLSLAQEFSRTARRRGSAGGLPYAGGIRISDKNSQVVDTDRVPPQFYIGQDQNALTAGIALPEPPDAGPVDVT